MKVSRRFLQAGSATLLPFLESDHEATDNADYFFLRQGNGVPGDNNELDRFYPVKPDHNP